MAHKAAQIWSAEALMDMLRAKFPPDRYGVLEQVADGTGRYCSSWIDAAVINLWPSDGMTRKAMEIKVSRSDFLKELTKGGKNSWARKYFHEFWFVMPKECIKDESEIPAGDGWMAPQKNGLVIKRHAQRKKAKIDDMFLCSLARSLQKGHEALEYQLRRNFQDKDPQFQEARNYQRAVETFLPSRRGSVYFDENPPPIKEIVKRLEEATLDGNIRDEKEELAKQALNFQEELMSFLEKMLVTVRHSVCERDEKGKLKIRNSCLYREAEIKTLWSYGRKEAKRRRKRLDMMLAVLNEFGKDS